MNVNHAYITTDKTEIAFYDIVFDEITKIAVELELTPTMIGNQLLDIDQTEKTWWISILDTKIYGEATRHINIVLRTHSKSGSIPFIAVEEAIIIKDKTWSVPCKQTSIQIADPGLFDKIKTILLDKITRSMINEVSHR